MNEYWAAGAIMAGVIAVAVIAALLWLATLDRALKEMEGEQ